MTIGIYLIKSKSVSDRFYIGSSINYEKRKREHLNKLRKNIHHSPKLQRHYNKYGKSDLEISVIEKLNDSLDILKHEQFYIDKFNPYFNCCKIAGNTLGFRHSEQTKSRMSLSKKGVKKLPFSKETRMKMSKARKLRVTKDSTRLKMSDARKGEKNINYGKKHRLETLQKMKSVKLGKKMTDETKAKHRSNMLGNTITKRRPVININTNHVYSTVKDAAFDLGMNVCTLQAMLSGRNPNKTNLEYYREV